MHSIIRYSEDTFESIKHINEFGQEYWLARELQLVLEYSQWRRFEETIIRAKEACENSGINVSEHFADVCKSSPMPNGGAREINDYQLSRYACYLSKIHKARQSDHHQITERKSLCSTYFSPSAFSVLFLIVPCA